MAKVFISFDYKDIESKKVVDNWKRQGLGTDISFTSEDGESHSPKGQSTVQKILREGINQSHIVLVLVGDNTHNRPWVDYEVHHAKCQGKRVIWTQIPNTSGAPPKEISKSKGIEFNLKKVQQAIRTL